MPVFSKCGKNVTGLRSNNKYGRAPKPVKILFRCRNFLFVIICNNEVVCGEFSRKVVGNYCYPKPSETWSGKEMAALNVDR